MNVDPTNTPDKWTGDGTFRVPGSPDPGVWINPRFRPVPEDDPRQIRSYLLWHWHQQPDGTMRWQGAGLGGHTLVAEHPLHLEPSLGCDGTDGVPNGCPAHGWIRNGRWVPA